MLLAMDKSLVELVSNTVFPVAVATFLLWWVTSKLNGKLDRLGDAINDLKEVLEELVDKVVGRDG